MRPVVPAILGLMIASMSLVRTGAAADMPPLYPLPAQLPGLYNWSGFYAGAQGGFGHGSFNVTERRSDIDGWFAGGQAGVNWQSGRSPWVVGIEVDQAFGNIERDVDYLSTTAVANAYSKVNSFGTARVRAGYAIDRALIYGTGGVAWAHSEMGFFALANQVNASASSSNAHVGFAVGAGLEWAVSRSWTVKFEYIFSDFGSQNYLAGTIPGGIDADLRFSAGRMGLNYIFDWGRPYSGPKY